MVDVDLPDRPADDRAGRRPVRAGAGRPRGRGPARRRQARGPRGPPGRRPGVRHAGQRPAGPLPRDPRRRRARPAGHRPPPRQGHVGAAGRRPQRRGLRRPGGDARAPRRSTAGTARSCGGRWRRRPGSSTPPSAARAASAPAWPSPCGASRPAPATRSCARSTEPVEVTELACRLETGRTHQIRVHLASIGHPVVGDGRYGGDRQSLPLPRPFLHAEQLGFEHPVTGEALRVHLAAARRPRAGPRRPQLRGVGRQSRLSAVSTSGHSRSPRAMAAMSARVSSSRWRRMWSLTIAQIGQQHALALVVAGAVLVGLAEVADGDRAVDRADDVAERDRRGLAGEDVAAADAPLGADEAGALQRQQDLLEVGLGEPGALGDVADRGGARLVAVQGQREQGPAGVVTSRRDLHGAQLYGLWAGEPRSPARAAGQYRACGGYGGPKENLNRVDDLVLPDYGGPCITNIVPALLGPPDEAPAVAPGVLADADQVVLLVVDGLGWEQLQARLRPSPPSPRWRARSITTVAPSTTATALTSTHDRPAAGRARRRGLPHRRPRRGAQRAALVDGGRRRPPEHPAGQAPADAAVPRRAARRW